mmetsp:Transcript_25796/g.49411  ORF Transcript_25796/g.49411 Transcript_25796/m.49411 type:complete len:162 (+) Transcript_25796:418-903(+)
MLGLLLLLLLVLLGLLLLTMLPADPFTIALTVDPELAEATQGLDIALEDMLLGVKATQTLGDATAAVDAGGTAAGAAVCETGGGQRAVVARTQLTPPAWGVGCRADAAQHTDCLPRTLWRASAMASMLLPWLCAVAGPRSALVRQCSATAQHFYAPVRQVA